MIRIQIYKNAGDNVGSEMTEQAVIDIIRGRGDAGQKIANTVKDLRTLSVINEANKRGMAAADSSDEQFNKQAQQQVIEYDELKKTLLGVTWSGLFCQATVIKTLEDKEKFRKGLVNMLQLSTQKGKLQIRTRAIEQHSIDSGLRVGDIDKEVITGHTIVDGKKKAIKTVQIASDEELNELKEKLSRDQHVHLVFISPSGNGLKVVFSLDISANERDKFHSIESYIQNNYGKKIDPSGKDISRLCFLSSDPTAHFNPDNTPLPILIFELPMADSEKAKLSKVTKKEIHNLEIIGQEPNDIWESTQVAEMFTSGNRNNFIFKYACNCNRVGISESDSRDFAQQFCPDKNPEEIKATINSAYSHNVHEHGKYKRLRKVDKSLSTASGKNTGNKGGGGNDQPPTVPKKYSHDDDDEPPFIFWKTITTEKGRGLKKYTTDRLELSRRDFRRFLFESGFHLLRTAEGSDGFQMVHSKDNIIKPVTPHEIKQFALDWCQEFNLPEVEEMLLKYQTKCFSKNELDSLPYKKVDIKRDTEQESYFYFENCFVAIKKDGEITEKKYDELDGFIWESSKIKHVYSKVDIEMIGFEKKDTHPTDYPGDAYLIPYDKMVCEFARFMAYCSYNPLCEEEKHFTKQMILDRFLCFCTHFGFLLDGHKHISRRLGVFAIDHLISDRYEANGRSGKSLIPQALEQFKKVANISGKTYDPKYQFADEPITMDSQIINYNDMPRNFDADTIFEKIADNYSVNRRNSGFIHFKYKESPKVYYSTNFAPKGEGDSYKARMSFIEFSDFFNASNTPYDVFGHGFFDNDSWSEDEYQRFFFFGLWCVSYYKENGLIPYPHPNIEARKLINTVVPEFVDFMDDRDYVPKNVRLGKIKLQEIFNEKFYVPLYNKKLSPHMFTLWVKQYCRSGNYILNPIQKGKHDKSNGTEYITIADDHYQESQTKLNM